MQASERTELYVPGKGIWCVYAFLNGQLFTYPLSDEPGSVFYLGRPSSSSTPDIPLNHRIVSRRHGEFRVTEEGLVYRSLSRTNGSILNGSLMEPDADALLQDGDVIQIATAEESDEIPVTVTVVRESLMKRDWCSLELDDSMAEVLIGRNEAMGISSGAVSQKHASFFRARQGWAIIDYGSRNGVKRNGTPVELSSQLNAGDCLNIAGYIFFYTGHGLLYQADADRSASSSASTSPEDNHLTIEIEERNVWHRAKKKTLLKDIRLEIDSGSMVLILGGSGAGKTTFINAVMGYEKAEGHISYHNQDIYEQYEQMKYEIGYVPQQDLLRLSDTVYDTLFNAAKMRLPRQADEEAYRTATEETMTLLGLEREKDNLVSKLSGGQRKRLSIAVEYIGRPQLFFLDEPDSGLDGVMARSLMERLRVIADQGKIVIVISHAPDRASDLFDKLIVLAKSTKDGSGHLAFYGSPDEAKTFFETDTLEGVVRRINRTDEGGEGLADYYIEKFANRGGNA